MSEIRRDNIHFTIDGEEVVSSPYETIWEAATRIGKAIPHLCHKETPGYKPDGNCRSCMVEIEGIGLESSCCLRPQPGMKVLTQSARASKARELVIELLLTDQPVREKAHNPNSSFWYWAEKTGIKTSRFPKRDVSPPDRSHAAITFNRDACILCNLCIRACSDIQGYDVIGIAGRNSRSRIIFDFNDPLGSSTCVACGECVQVCPTGALMPSTVLNEEQVMMIKPDRKIDSVCPYCGVGCQITYNVKNNEIIYIDGQNGPANENRLCVKGRFGFDYVKHPHRLTRPLIRLDDAQKHAELEVDPANPLTHFREAGWDEALDVAASGLKQILERDGKHALAGLGSAKCTNEEAYLFQKLVRTGFGTNHVDHCTRLCHAASVAALLECIGSAAVSAPFTAALDADVIIVIGANPVENHPVAASYIRQACRIGTTLIVMDPRNNALSKQATHNLQFKPGTDVALLNALLYTIVREKLYDTRYIETHTEGFEALKLHIQDYAPEKMEAICGIDAHTLRTVARKYATAHRSIIFWGMGISQSVHGTDNARCLIALALITGQIGRTGTGLHPLRGQNNVQGASDAGLIPFAFPNYQFVEDDNKRAGFEEFWGASLDPERGLTVVEMMDAALDGSIKGMYFMGENPAMSDPDVHHVRAALSRLEHLVIQDIFLTETAAFADVVLPATAWPEKEGTVTNTNRQIQMGRKAIDAPGNARADWWIVQEIARRFGLNWNYEKPADVYEEMRRCMPSIENISWERLINEGAVTYPCQGDHDPGQDIVFSTGFPTEDGRGKLVPVSITPDNEAPDDDYPMILTTGRMLEHWHTGAMTRRSQVLDALEPEAIAMLCCDDMERLGIKPGELARISTRRGSIEIRVRHDDTVPEGMVFIPFCWAEAPANHLTSAKLDPFGKVPGSKLCGARVEKLDAGMSR
ncbi:MAG: formate dehydrogenase subunit alpha [Gammaproteobacteria bacterium RBG_16_51_14]|nr:MAG: formate dehydrogenase subunit alpha [Gammaproteobacteria bacterium RBG_16_51_14]